MGSRLGSKDVDADAGAGAVGAVGSAEAQQLVSMVWLGFGILNRPNRQASKQTELKLYEMSRWFDTGRVAYSRCIVEGRQ